MRAPRICSCGRKVEAGTRCQCRAAFDAARKARFDETRPSASERGYGGKWQNARRVYLEEHPHCARCGKPANVVDHITPHKGDLDLFWRRSNWQPLCTPCHSSAKQRLERRGSAGLAIGRSYSPPPEHGRRTATPQRGPLRHGAAGPGGGRELSPVNQTGARTSTRHTPESSLPKDDPWR